MQTFQEALNDTILKKHSGEAKFKDISEALAAIRAENAPYTNSNDLGTLTGAFAIGAGNMANDATFGGTGQILGALGRAVEWISPFSGDPLSEKSRTNLMAAGFSPDEINAAIPYEDSWLTSAAKGTLDIHNSIDDSLTDWRQQLLGDNPTLAARIAEGSGSSFGFMGLGALGAGLGGTLGAASAMGIGEALTESGGFMGDAYRQGQYEQGLGLANKNLLANAVLNTGLNYLLGYWGKGAEKIANKLPGGTLNPYVRYGVGTLTETLNELAQEPSQQVIEQASLNALNNGTGFMSELGESVKQWPETFAQLAPEVTGSTLLTQILFGLGAVSTKAGRQNIRNQYNISKFAPNAEETLTDNYAITPDGITPLYDIDVDVKNIKEDDIKDIVEERDNLLKELNETVKSGNFYNDKDLQQKQIHLANLQQTINNYMKSPEQMRNETIARQHEQAVQAVQNVQDNQQINQAGQPQNFYMTPQADELVQPQSQSQPVDLITPVNDIEVNNTPQDIQAIQSTTDNVQNNNDKANTVKDKKELFRQQVRDAIFWGGNTTQAEAEAASHVFMQEINYFSNYAGLNFDSAADLLRTGFGYKDEIFDKVTGEKISGNIDFRNDTAYILFSKEADPSTIVHEMAGHRFLRAMEILARSGQLKGRALQDWNTVTKNYKIDNIDFSLPLSDLEHSRLTEAHENFATDVEHYFWTGEAPNSKLKHVFENFKRWLKRIYSALSDIEYVGADGIKHKHNYELSPAMKELFNVVFGDEVVSSPEGEVNLAQSEQSQTETTEQTEQPQTQNIEVIPPFREDASTPQNEQQLSFTFGDNEQEVQLRDKIKEEPRRVEVSQNTPDIAVSNNMNYAPENRNTARVRTMKGTEVDVRYRVIEADDLIPSTKESGAPNPLYPQELQPRQRNRSSSWAQIDRIARNIDPELLAENRLASDGAPIIGSDMVVESGNGRILGIQRAYKEGMKSANKYRNWIFGNATRFGLDPEYVQTLKKPVLVRERISDVDRLKFTSEANEASVSVMSAGEHAIEDAKLLTPYRLNRYDTDKTFEGNRNFVASIIFGMPKNEQGDLIQKDGSPSIAGFERVRNALIAKAYNDTTIVNRLSELPDDDIRNVSNALTQAAPKIAVFEESSIRPELSLRNDIMQAVNIFSNLKKLNQSVDEYLGQADLFPDEDGITSEAKTLLKAFNDNKRSAKRIAQVLMNYADIATQEAKANQMVLPGFEDSIRDKKTILEEAIKAVNEERKINTQDIQNNNNEIFNQPLHSNVKLDENVNVVKISDTLPDVPFYQRMKAFGKEHGNEYLPETYNQLIGKRGAQELDMKNGNHNYIENLGKAQLMTKAGKDEQTIWLATGWWKAPDNKWRMDLQDGRINKRNLNKLINALNAHEDLSIKVEDILDNPNYSASEANLLADKIYHSAKFKNVQKKLNEKHYLHEFYNNPTLFDVYPNLKNIKFEIRTLPNNINGEFIPSSNTIVVDKKLSNDKIRSTLIHEIQHAVQDIEDFARGGDSDLFEASYQKYKSERDRLNKEIENIYAKTPELDDNIKKLKAEIRKEAIKQDMTVSEFDDFEKKTYIPERTKLENASPYAKELQELREQIETLEKERMKKYSNIEKDKEAEPYNLYRRLGGEIDARLAANMAKFTKSQRQKNVPSSFMDVDKSEWHETYNQSVRSKVSDEQVTEIYNQISKKRKSEMDKALTNHRPDLNAEQRKVAIDEIEKLGEQVKEGGSSKHEKAAIKWLIGGHIRLPEDNYKIIDAIKICEQQRLDPMKYADPNEILAKYTIKEGKASQRINPDNVPEFSNKVDYGNGITVYNVEDNKAGQRAVRNIIDTHWNKEANPWCLARRMSEEEIEDFREDARIAEENGEEWDSDKGDDINELSEAWDMWNNYNTIPKRIAFKNGKLLAFCASDLGETEWWDREDKSSKSIPYTVKRNGDTINYVYDEVDKQHIKKSETLANGTYRTFNTNGKIDFEKLPDGTKRSYRLVDGSLDTEYLPDGTYHQLYPNGQLFIERLKDGSDRRWDRDGVLRFEYNASNQKVRFWTANGKEVKTYEEAFPETETHNQAVRSRVSDEQVTEIYNQIGSRRKAEMDKALTQHRMDLTPEQRKIAIDEIEKLGEQIKEGGSPKHEKAAIKWLIGGHIRLPEDNYKIIDSVKICEQQHLDPMQFTDPNEILAKYTIKETKAEKRINPDTVKAFSNKVDYGNGITVYTVQDNGIGQAAVRRIIDTHWGEKANPWCLATREKNTYNARNMWKYYSTTEKRIAFKDGKLLAFCASDTGEIQWWDREDQPTAGIPYTVKNKGNTIDYIFDENTGKSVKVHEKLSNGIERRFNVFEQLEIERLPDGTIRFYKNDENYYYKEELPNGTIREFYKSGELKSELLPDKTVRLFYKNGKLGQEALLDGTIRQYDKEGILRLEYIPNSVTRLFNAKGQEVSSYEEASVDKYEGFFDYDSDETYNQSMHSNAPELNAKEQLDAVRKQYEGTDKWLKAPNGNIYYQPIRTDVRTNEHGKKKLNSKRSFLSWLRRSNIDNRSLHIPSADTELSSNNLRFENELTERRYSEATKGVQKPTLTQRIKLSTHNILKSFRSPFSELASDKDLLPAKNLLEQLGRKQSIKAQESMNSFVQNIKSLTPNQRNLFARKRLLDDLMWRKQQLPDAELPFGFDDDMLKREHDRFTKLAEKNKPVMDAIKAEENTMKSISDEFASLAKDLGLNLDNVFKNPHYYRHTILEYANAAAMGRRSGNTNSNSASAMNNNNNNNIQSLIDEKLNDIRNRNFLKRYKGSSLDISTSYIQANGEVRTQMLMDIEMMKTLKEIKEKYDKASTLRERLRQLFSKKNNNTYSQGEGLNLSDVIPEGYSLYNPAGSRLIQSANSATENVIAMALDDASEQSGIPLDEILNSMENSETLLNQLWVIPTNLKESLKNLARSRDRGILGNSARVLTNWWKRAVLFTPTRVLKYNFRNFTGDLDAVIAGRPDALRFFGQAVRELTAHYRGRETTQDLQEYIERAGGLNIESLQLSENDLNSLQNFANETSKNPLARGARGTWNAIRGFFQAETALTQWREHLLRYAAYLSYKHDIDSHNGTPSTWGASIKDEIMALDDNRDKAFKLSNELLGDYQNISEIGKQLRDFAIPFWSWSEMNAKRYYRLLKNGFSGDNSSDFTKRLLIGQAARTPFYALSAAETFGKIALFTMLVQSFNRFFFPDDDDELPEDVKYRPHLTLGKVNGKVYYFDRIGALADNLDWLNLDSIFLDSKQLANGQQSFGNYFKKMAQAPVSKVINSLNPIITMPIELATGRSMYPDAFNSRTIKNNGQYIASSLGLSWPYKAVTGEPRNDWDELSNMIIYSLDPDEAAYWQTLDKVRQFQNRVLDKHFDGFASTKRGQVLQKLKMALRYNDKTAVRRYLKEYAKLDGTKKGLKQSMLAMNPLHGLSTKEKKQFMKWITADDRKYLKKAERYYHKLADRYTK